MAKHIPKTLTLTKLTSSLFLSKNPSKPSPISLSSRFLSHRNFHTKAQLTDPDSDPSSSAASSGAGFIFSDDIEGELGFRTLSEAIQYVMVRNAAPDWLPFMPGSSYWVPPKRKMQNKFLEVVGEFVDPMTMEESLSLRSSRGWPCSEVLLDRGSIYEDPIGVKEEMQMHAQTRPERTSPRMRIEDQQMQPAVLLNSCLCMLNLNAINNRAWVHMRLSGLASVLTFEHLAVKL